jgi:hypothetical protein
MQLSQRLTSLNTTSSFFDVLKIPAGGINTNKKRPGQTTGALHFKT